VKDQDQSFTTELLAGLKNRRSRQIDEVSIINASSAQSPLQLSSSLRL
jgi:hypothetical protein